MSDVSVTGWIYDAEAGRYRREQNGVPFTVTGPDPDDLLAALLAHGCVVGSGALQEAPRRHPDFELLRPALLRLVARRRLLLLRGRGLLGRVALLGLLREALLRVPLLGLATRRHLLADEAHRAASHAVQQADDRAPHHQVQHRERQEDSDPLYRTGVDHQDLAAAGHPGFEIELAVRRAAQVARGDIEHPVRDPQAVEDFALQIAEVIVHVLALFRQREGEHLDFCELMDSVKAPRGPAGGGAGTAVVLSTRGEEVGIGDRRVQRFPDDVLHAVATMRGAQVRVPAGDAGPASGRDGAIFQPGAYAWCKTIGVHRRRIPRPYLWEMWKG